MCINVQLYRIFNNCITSSVVNVKRSFVGVFISRDVHIAMEQQINQVDLVNEDDKPISTFMCDAQQKHFARREKTADVSKEEDEDDASLLSLFGEKQSDLVNGDSSLSGTDEKEEGEEMDKAEEKRMMQNAQREFNAEVEKQKLARLSTLLDRANLYSQFLLKKISLPTAPKEEDEQTNGESEMKTNGTQKKRKAEREDAEPDVPSKKIKSKESEGEEMPLIAQPKLITGGKMRAYQLQGTQWLISLYENGLAGILADEMGLGKTVQCISLIAHLVEQQVSGPFLVTAPLSTLQNWVNEFQFWTPSIRVIKYHGSKQEREELRKKELNLKRLKNRTFPVVVTSYEIVMRDKKFLSKYQWKYIIVDEGHRIKNLNCRLIKELKSYHSVNRLLLTGTPLQNSLSELWSMLNFLLPEIFDDLDSFQSWFDFSEIGEKDGEQKIIAQEESNQIVSKLHRILRPFLLRRVKRDVELELPTKQEKIVFTSMTPLQMKYYEAILYGKLDTVLSPFARQQMKNRGTSLQNTLVHLRKCCNHPYLFHDWPLDSRGEEIVDESLVAASGKLLMLDRILPRLKQEGHRVLIFSQMTLMLNILEDYLNFRGHNFYRIDGNTKQSDREQQIQDFNKSSKVFCFLLSTRAGGLGINLTGADTVIFYDNDWNPQVDLQAQDRCHRIGQTKPVRVYRFATANSIESKILERQTNKLKLDRLVIQKGNFVGVKASSLLSEISSLIEALKSDMNDGEQFKEVTDDVLFNWD